MADHNSLDAAILRQWVCQRLQSLSRFGVRELSGPKGNAEFHFADPAPAVVAPPEQRARANVMPAPDGAASNKGTQVGEPRTDHGSSTRAGKELDRSGRVTTPVVKPAMAERVITGEYSQRLDESKLTERLQILRDSVAGCMKCPELSGKRCQTVFGEGNIRPRLVFLGEAPGEDEDRAGKPFVGRAEQLLTKIIGAMKLTRDDVFILNTVKCRPTLNRNPNESELANCWDFLTGQLDLLQPEIICCLGSVAARTLLNTTDSIGRLRGQFHQYKSSKVLVTYHPSYLLRVEGQVFRGKSPKKMVWDDMKMILAELE